MSPFAAAAAAAAAVDVDGQADLAPVAEGQPPDSLISNTSSGTLGGLDVVACVEALYDIQEDPEAAKKFLRTSYKVLASAVRTGNKSQALTYARLFLQLDM
eukprot:gene9128-9297_t